jgi:F0F1-type ATP synthase membrane subunit b/b'
MKRENILWTVAALCVVGLFINVFFVLPLMASFIELQGVCKKGGKA